MGVLGYTYYGRTRLYLLWAYSAILTMGVLGFGEEECRLRGGGGGGHDGLEREDAGHEHGQGGREQHGASEGAPLDGGLLRGASDLHHAT
eukprot:scaffold99610_cov57-Phaeocystis_antarctica.AAC.2